MGDAIRADPKGIHVGRKDGGVMGQLPETFFVVAGDLFLLLCGRNDLAKDRAMNLWPTSTFFKCPRKNNLVDKNTVFPLDLCSGESSRDLGSL